MTLLDALAIAQAVRRGDAVLLTPVIFHRQEMSVSVGWKPVHGVADAVLEWHRQRLQSALQARTKAMEAQSLDGLTEAEVDTLMDKYLTYRTILEVNQCDTKP